MLSGRLGTFAEEEARFARTHPLPPPLQGGEEELRRLINRLTVVASGLSLARQRNIIPLPAREGLGVGQRAAASMPGGCFPDTRTNAAAKAPAFARAPGVLAR